MVDTLVSGTRILLGCASSSLVPGKSESFNDSKLIFLPDNPEDTANIAIDTIINKCTLKVENQINTVDVKVIKNDTEIEFLICN